MNSLCKEHQRKLTYSSFLSGEQKTFSTYWCFEEVVGETVQKDATLENFYRVGRPESIFPKVPVFPQVCAKSLVDISDF